MMHQFGPNDIGKCFLPTPTAPDEGVKALVEVGPMGKVGSIERITHCAALAMRDLQSAEQAVDLPEDHWVRGAMRDGSEGLKQVIAAARTELPRLQSDNARLREMARNARLSLMAGGNLDDALTAFAQIAALSEGDGE